MIGKVCVKGKIIKYLFVRVVLIGIVIYLDS